MASFYAVVAIVCGASALHLAFKPGTEWFGGYPTPVVVKNVARLVASALVVGGLVILVSANGVR